MLADRHSEVEVWASQANAVQFACEELSKVETIHEIRQFLTSAEATVAKVRRERLGIDALLNAQSVWLLTMRRVGQLIREAQDRGEVRTRGANLHSVGAASLNDVFTIHKRSDAYALSDDISDEQFLDALESCRAEGNVSKANLLASLNVRDRNQPVDADKLTTLQRREAIRDFAEAGLTSQQIGLRLKRKAAYIRAEARKFGIRIPADEVVGKTKGFDPNRMLPEMVSAVEGLAYSVDLIGDLDELDSTQLDHWIESLTESLRPLNKFLKSLKEKRGGTYEQ